MREHQIFGPPGTGKTTYLARQIEIAASKHGQDNILVASYTKTAAEELVSRGTAIPPDAIGTLHSLCYRALGQPTIAETKIDEFNQQHSNFILTQQEKSNMDDAVEGNYATEGDALFARYRLQRARLLPIEAMDKQAVAFAQAWESWKTANSYVDFTDMIDFTILFDTPPPGRKQIGIYDESQDFDALQLKLVRKWAEKQEYVLLAGDDDQCLFSFSGANPTILLNPETPVEQKRVLSQSWRVPRAVHSFANAWIQQLPNRQPKEYKPREVDGELRRSKARYIAPAMAVDEAQKYVENGKSVMLLASCGYMLNNIKHSLRADGIPFHNPYKKSRGDLNPLGSFSGNGKIRYSKDRLMAFLDDGGIVYDNQAYWNMDKLSLWASMMNTKGIMKRGAKARIESEAEFPTIFNPEEMAIFFRDCFEEHAWGPLLARDVRWFHKNLLPAKANSLDFAIKVYTRQGIDGLLTKPKIILSTIHGAKGGESDVVFLFPDVSRQGMQEWNSRGEGHDAVVRMMYVGMTRAKENLIVCAPSSQAFIKL